MQVESPSQVETAVAEGGAYEVLRRRLDAQGATLRTRVEALNAERLQVFGSSRMETIGRVRIATEHNCIPRDIVEVGDALLFGYNVFMGLKKTTRVEDVFSLYRLVEAAEGYDVVPVDPAGTFLAEPAFVKDFGELFAYYQHARLLQLAAHDGLLLASFQIGERIDDVRVLRWSVSGDGTVRYVDNRGERDIAPPPARDFEWQRAGREQAVAGKHPHMNILDTVFVETVNGDLTVKIENNTDSGLGIYSEPVEDRTQSLDDARIEYAKVGALVLLRVLPYRETVWRHLAYSPASRRVHRIDAIGQACVQLPEDHGIVFPGGYLLQNGDVRTFDQNVRGMRFHRTVRAPNGEDVLYAFYAPEDGRIALFVYNTIERGMQPPVIGHGCARLDDGRMVIFSADDTPTRVHPMQVWRTPFASEAHALRQPRGEGFFGKIGNAELVRGLSDLLDLAREISAAALSAAHYQRLTQSARRLFDRHHWIEDAHCDGLAPLLREIVASSESVLDEYEKVESLRRRAAEAMAEAETRQRELLDRLHPDRWERVQDCVDALNALSSQRGRWMTLREARYVDLDAVAAFETALLDAQTRTATAVGAYLADPRVLQPYDASIRALDAEAQQATGVAALRAPLEAMRTLSADLDMLSELMATLPVDDAAQRTRVVEALSALYAKLNQARARAEQRRKTLGEGEAVAQFGAQFALFGQGIAGALSSARDPDACDQALSRLLLQLEEIEGRFGEHDTFLADIATKREELIETFEAHKQTLVDERQRRAQSLADAAARILDGLPRRTERLGDADALNAFFAGDPLVVKLRDLAARLRELKDSVKADDIESRLKRVRDQSMRTLRDRSDLFEAGGNVVRLGPRHRFSVNTQALDLTLLPRGDGLALHLTGTGYFAPVQDAELDALRDVWSATLESESPLLARAEYLVGDLLAAAEQGQEGLSLDRMRGERPQPDALAKTVREFAAQRYRDGYEKGIHDHDAARLLSALLPLRDAAGALAHGPDARAWASVAWAALRARPEAARWPDRARNAQGIDRVFAHRAGLEALRVEIAETLRALADAEGLALDATLHARAAAYLVDILAAPRQPFVFSRYARELREALRQRLEGERLWDELLSALAVSGDTLGARWRLAMQWCTGLVADPAHAALATYAPEAAALLLLGDEALAQVRETELQVRVDGLLSEHARIVDGAVVLGVDDFAERLRRHREEFLPRFRRCQAMRQALVAREREALRLSEFQAKPLTSFVRNRLIDEVYLSLVGDNLAKQMGAVGEAKRSDLMGLLMLISPPGYGKTTLMEYVAHQLGLIFMKINGPALGHGVRSLDPAQAPDATARQELEKLNLALEMGDNVMLYVDDIQHTHAEFLQKFISLCDGTRRIEGVWRGRTRTYDLRGRKFCVVMAGNPYTESGEVFRVPDMLANRADVYNLGDVLGGREQAFLLSYLENALTSNPVLAPLAQRDPGDLHKLVDKAEGRPFSSATLSHAYGPVEIDEIVATMQRLIRVRDTVYAVNRQYIASAAQADRYRTEPPFKLQGSYRNMNKLAEKLSPAMNEAEVQQLIADHYRGEAQLLTGGAEENLLRLGELRGTLDATQAARWAQIKRDFQRDRATGAGEAEVGPRVVAQLHDLVESVRGLATPAPAAETPVAAPRPDAEAPWPQLLAALERLSERLSAPAAAPPVPSPVAPSAVASPGADWFERHAEQQMQLQQVLARLVERLSSLPVAPSPTAGKRARAMPTEGPALAVALREEQLKQALEEFSDRLLGKPQG